MENEPEPTTATDYSNSIFVSSAERTGAREKERAAQHMLIFVYSNWTIGNIASRAYKRQQRLTEIYIFHVHDVTFIAVRYEQRR